MTYATIEDGESTPLYGGQSDTDTAPSTNNKYASSAIVRALMMGTAVGVLLLMAGPSKMTMTSSNNVDGMVVVSSTATQDSTDCAPATGTFSGLSCKDSDGYCAGPGSSWGGYAKMHHFETCYVSQNGYCWSRSHEVDKALGSTRDGGGRGRSLFLVEPGAIDHNYIMNNYQVDTAAPKPVQFHRPSDNTFFTRCDPDGYIDGDFGYEGDGIWHVSAPLSDGSCGNPCREFI